MKMVYGPFCPKWLLALQTAQYLTAQNIGSSGIDKADGEI